MQELVVDEDWPSSANNNSPDDNTGGRTNTSASRYNHYEKWPGPPSFPGPGPSFECEHMPFEFGLTAVPAALGAVPVLSWRGEVSLRGKQSSFLPSPNPTHSLPPTP